MKRYRPYKFEENILPREILKQYTKVQNIYKDLYKKIAIFETDDSSVPAGPNSMSFRASLSGEINLYFNIIAKTVGFTSLPYKYNIILKKGSAINIPFRIADHLEKEILKKTLFKKSGNSNYFSFEDDGKIYRIFVTDTGGTNFWGYFCSFSFIDKETQKSNSLILK